MASFLFAGLFLALAVLPAAGQGRRMSDEERKEAFDANFAEMTTALALDDATAPRVKEILWTQQQNQTKLMADMRQGGGNAFARQGMREKMTEMRAETEALLADVLSEEQMAAYQAFQAERQRGGRGAGQGRRQSQPQ
jgi:hypothetical protein